MELRSMEREHLSSVLALNQSEVPAVGSLDAAGLERLRSMARHAVVAVAGDEVAGFVLALGPGADYASENYRWFAQRYDDFVYVDRVAVAPGFQRRGVGHLLYDAVEDATDAAHFLCEVNLRPRNDASLRFHERRGFRTVGEQDTEGGAKRVALLEKPLSGASVV